MDKGLVILFAIILFIILALIFIILYRINKKIAPPKGSKELERDEFSCAHCSHSECEFYLADKKEKK